MNVVVDRIDALVKEYGGLRAVARALKVEPSYLCKVRQGDKRPSENMLRALGLVRKVTVVGLVEGARKRPCETHSSRYWQGSNETCDAILAAIAALPDAQAWHPIKTAPKTGALFELCRYANGRFVWIGIGHYYNGAWREPGSDKNEFWYKPTHFREMIAPKATPMNAEMNERPDTLDVFDEVVEAINDLPMASQCKALAEKLHGLREPIRKALAAYATERAARVGGDISSLDDFQAECVRRTIEKGGASLVDAALQVYTRAYIYDKEPLHNAAMIYREELIRIASASPTPPAAQVVAAYLHTVVQDDGHEDQALSFAPDSFPFEGVGGFKSIAHQPLYRYSAPANAKAGEVAQRIDSVRRHLVSVGAHQDYLDHMDVIAAYSAPANAKAGEQFFRIVGWWIEEEQRIMQGNAADIGTYCEANGYAKPQDCRVYDRHASTAAPAPAAQEGGK